MTTEESYAWCEGVARSQAKNFYYSFLLLSKPQRSAMCAIYAFMRYCDDLSDDDGIADRPAAIARWRADLEAALAGRHLFAHHAGMSTTEEKHQPTFRDAIREQA